jgi:hypothetical protein
MMANPLWNAPLNAADGRVSLNHPCKVEDKRKQVKCVPGEQKVEHYLKKEHWVISVTVETRLPEIVHNFITGIINKNSHVGGTNICRVTREGLQSML